MPLRDLLSAPRIALVDQRLDRRGVIDLAARLLAADAAPDPSVAELADALQAREAVASTAIGHGVAIPHGRFGGLDASRGAFLRLEQPVDFGAADGSPVDLVMALAVPRHAVQEHLHQLADLAQRFADRAFRERLRAAPGLAALQQALLASGDAP